MPDKADEDRFPLFIVAGMPRGGTTFLYNVLGKHPSIFVPFRKEVNYFTVNYDRGLSWYQSLYEERDENQVAGDFSPPCFMDRKSIDRILSYDPNVKIIISVRDPVDWALSFYQQFKSFTFNMPSFKDFLEGYDYEIAGKVLKVKSKDNYIVEMINIFKEKFGKNVFIYDYYFFEKNPLAVLKEIERFIGVEPYFSEANFQNVRINASGRKNIKPLQYLLSREWFIKIMENILPRKAILYFRTHFDYASASPSKKHEKFVHPEENILFAKEALNDQSHKIKELFELGPIQLGSGEVCLRDVDK